MGGKKRVKPLNHSSSSTPATGYQSSSSHAPKGGVTQSFSAAPASAYHQTSISGMWLKAGPVEPEYPGYKNYGTFPEKVSAPSAGNKKQ